MPFEYKESILSSNPKSVDRNPEVSPIPYSSGIPTMFRPYEYALSPNLNYRREQNDSSKEINSGNLS